jgi:hypothetical protein
MCNDDLGSLVRRLRGCYDELDAVRLELSFDDQAELKVLGELISLLARAQEPRKHWACSRYGPADGSGTEPLPLTGPDPSAF